MVNEEEEQKNEQDNQNESHKLGLNEDKSNINEVIESRIQMCLDFIIIPCDSKGYKIFISIVNTFCVITSYYYMYVAAFGGATLHFEILFFFDMMINFFVDYSPDDNTTNFRMTDSSTESIHIRDFRKIAKNYFNKNFLHDLIPLLPLQYLQLKMKSERLFFLIKCYRLKRGLKEANVPAIMFQVKKYYMKHIKEFSENNPEIAEDPMIDNNKMMQIMAITLFLRTMKLVLLIVNFSYFIGMGWYIMCQTIQNYKILARTNIDWYDFEVTDSNIAELSNS